MNVTPSILNLDKDTVTKLLVRIGVAYSVKTASSAETTIKTQEAHSKREHPTTHSIIPSNLKPKANQAPPTTKMFTSTIITSLILGLT
jgi:hypothetical protein